MVALRTFIPGAAILILLTCRVASAQTADPQKTTSKLAAPDTAEPTKNSQNIPSVQNQAEQPTSVAEAARLARANKGTGPKAAKSYDDDNFPRTAPIVKKTTTDTAAGNPSIENLPPDMQGKVVLLDFWASWCGPCRMALPKVKELQSIYGGDDFMVVSVSEDDDVGTWRTFVANHGMIWTQRFDGDNSLIKQFQVNGLPTYILLDRDGKEVQRYVGEDPGQSILERVGPDLKRTLQTKQSASK